MVSNSPTTSTVDPDTVARLRVAVVRLARRMRQNLDDVLTPTQHSALATIRSEGPIALHRLSEIEKVARPTVTKVVDKLRLLGVIELRPDTSDRRVVIAEITEQGLSLLAERRERKATWFDSRVALLNEVQRTKLTDALEVIEALVDASQR